jgi:shikimate kinase
VIQKKQKFRPNIYLIGFMGVGKSTVGNRLARELNYSFFDSDEAIEKRVGKTIPEIFADEGEAAFRQYEREFIDSGHPAEGCVISCGGGLVIQEGMTERLKSKGIVICLFASLESILKRTQRNMNRPLLNVDDPEARIRELLAAREPIYMNAGICISTEGRTISEVVRHLQRTYRTAVERKTSKVERLR